MLEWLRLAKRKTLDSLAPIKPDDFRFVFTDRSTGRPFAESYPRPEEGRKPDHTCVFEQGDKLLHVLLCTDFQTRQGLFALISSILTNTNYPERLFFHILVDDNPDYYQKIIDCTFTDQAKYEVVSFKNTARYQRNNDFLRKNIKAIGTVQPDRINCIMNYTRFYLPEIFPEVKTGLYLDTDMVVQTDLTALLHAGLTSHIVAAPLNRRFEGYHKDLELSGGGFNAGFLLINFEHWRANNVTQALEYVMKRHKKRTLFNGGTQPILNLVFYQQCFHMYNFWNRTGLGWKEDMSPVRLKEKWILHWTGKRKPWLENGLYKEFWEKYRIPLPEDTNDKTN